MTASISIKSVANKFATVDLPDPINPIKKIVIRLVISCLTHQTRDYTSSVQHIWSLFFLFLTFFEFFLSTLHGSIHGHLTNFTFKTTTKHGTHVRHPSTTHITKCAHIRHPSWHIWHFTAAHAT